MESSEIVLKPEGDDVLVRLILNPKQISKETGLFDEDALLTYTKLDSNKKNKKSPIAWSVGLRRAFKDDGEVHLYGCRTADTARKETHKRKIEKDSQAQISREPNYLGFYEFVRTSILEKVIDGTQVKIEQKTEHGETAHCNVSMFPSEGMDSGKWSDARTDFIAAFGVVLRGPRRHICEVDNDIKAELEKVVLPVLPRESKQAA